MEKTIPHEVSDCPICRAGVPIKVLQQSAIPFALLGKVPDGSYCTDAKGHRIMFQRSIPCNKICSTLTTKSE